MTNIKKRANGIQKTLLPSLCMHGQRGCDRSWDIYYSYHPRHIGNIIQMDWWTIDRETRLALFFSSLVGLYSLQKTNYILDEHCAAAERILVQSVTGKQPCAVIAGFRESDAYRPQKVRGKLKEPVESTAKKQLGRERLRDLRYWAFTVSLSIKVQFDYDWYDFRTATSGLEAHGRKVPADNPLCSLLGWMINTPEEHQKRLGNYTVRHCLRHECWAGLGRWSVLQDRFVSQFPDHGQY